MQFYNPVHIIAGSQAIKDLKTYLNANSLHRILLVTRGGNFHYSDAFLRLSIALEDCSVTLYPFEISNPDIADLFQILKELEAKSFDLIIGAGGGSVIDIAKSIASLHGIAHQSVNDLRQTIEKKIYLNNKNQCGWIGIPTTSGTGSEVTSWATIWDTENICKYSIDNPDNYARCAVIDPIFTVNLPLKTTVSTACDALCHATEAYWSKNTNDISRAFALIAIEKITENLKNLLKNPDDLDLREEVAKGSLFAGLAFSNTKTTACHSISYPLTMMYHIDHGVAATVTLTKVMEYNQDVIPDISRLLNAFHVKTIDEIQEWIESIFEIAGYPASLSGFDIPFDELPLIIERAYTKGRMDNNPKEIKPEHLLEILKCIF